MISDIIEKKSYRNKIILILNINIKLLSDRFLRDEELLSYPNTNVNKYIIKNIKHLIFIS
jgi:hypothetical protein